MILDIICFECAKNKNLMFYHPKDKEQTVLFINDPSNVPRVCDVSRFPCTKCPHFVPKEGGE